MKSQKNKHQFRTGGGKQLLLTRQILPKFIAWALTLAMIIALVPAVSFTVAGAAANDYTNMLSDFNDFLDEIGINDSDDIATSEVDDIFDFLSAALAKGYTIDDYDFRKETGNSSPTWFVFWVDLSDGDEYGLNLEFVWEENDGQFAIEYIGAGYLFVAEPKPPQDFFDLPWNILEAIVGSGNIDNDYVYQWFSYLLIKENAKGLEGLPFEFGFWALLDFLGDALGDSWAITEHDMTYEDNNPRDLSNMEDDKLDFKVKLKKGSDLTVIDFAWWHNLDNDRFSLMEIVVQSSLTERDFNRAFDLSGLKAVVDRNGGELIANYTGNSSNNTSPPYIPPSSVGTGGAVETPDSDTTPETPATTPETPSVTVTIEASGDDEMFDVPVLLNENTGAVTVQLDEETAETLIENAIAQAETQGGGAVPTVTLDFSELISTAAVAVTTVVLTAETAQTFSEAQLAVRIILPGGVVMTLPPAVLAKLSAATNNGAIYITIRPTK